VNHPGGRGFGLPLKGAANPSNIPGQAISNRHSALSLQTTESFIKQTSMFRLLLHKEFNLPGMNKEPNADS